MLKVYADFNDSTADGGYWNLWIHGARISERAAQLGLTIGETVCLYQDEDDFEVVALLSVEHVEVLGRNTWVARPDWSTLSRK